MGRVAQGFRGRWRFRGDGGSTAIEFVLLTPILFVLIFSAVQYAIFFHARHVALAAAQAGARVARASAGDPTLPCEADARDKAQAYLQQLGGNLVRLNAGGIEAHCDGDIVGVRVQGTAPSILPLIDIPIDVQSDGPVEKFREDTG
jgi:Flp pilus assembly protein TadG